jgi:hypothetical protein
VIKNQVFKLSMMVYTYNSSTWVAAAGGSYIVRLLKKQKQRTGRETQVVVCLPSKCEEEFKPQYRTHTHKMVK